MDDLQRVYDEENNALGIEQSCNLFTMKKEQKCLKNSKSNERINGSNWSIKNLTQLLPDFYFIIGLTPKVSHPTTLLN